MPARDEQQQIGKFQIRVGQTRAERMAFEVIDRDQRLARRMRQRLAGDEPDHHPADQPRPRRRRDRIDIGQRNASIGQRRRDQRAQHLDMRARGDFGHHAAIRPVRRLLPRKPVRQDTAIRGDEGGGGFVAARFKAEDEQCHGNDP